MRNGINSISNWSWHFVQPTNHFFSNIIVWVQIKPILSSVCFFFFFFCHDFICITSFFLSFQYMFVRFFSRPFFCKKRAATSSLNIFTDVFRDKGPYFGENYVIFLKKVGFSVRNATFFVFRKCVFLYAKRVILLKDLRSFNTRKIVKNSVNLL